MSKLTNVTRPAPPRPSSANVGGPQAKQPIKGSSTPSSSASPGADTWEEHCPKPVLSGSAAGRSIDKVLDKVAPIRTHERVISEVKGSLFGLEVGITLSQLELVKKNTHGVEVIQVVNGDGSSNLETVLGRFSLNHNHRIELQGPALNSSLTPGELPLGARFIGVGLTSDVTSAMDHDAVSYTAEVKLTTNSLLQLAAIGGPGAAAVAADALATVAGGAVAEVIGDILIGAVPILSAALALQSARRAVHVCRDEAAPTSMKVFAVAHAISDAVRVAFPLAGTLANVALVGIAAVMGWRHIRHAKHAEPVGPDAKPPVFSRDAEAATTGECAPEATPATSPTTTAADAAKASAS